MSEHHPRSPHRPADWVGAWSERRARLTPESVGLIDWTTGDSYTYRQLDRRANRVARLLYDHGVSADAPTAREDAGGRVAVVSRNRPELVDLFFATGKTGGVLAPLSHRLAAPELETLLETIDPALVVVEEPFESTVESAIDDESAFETLIVPTEGNHEGASFEAALPADETPVETATLSMDDAHLFLHTGGSTGVPKETVLTHGGIVWNSLNTITAWGIRGDDCTPMAFPMFHTGGWNVITIPVWHMGGTVVIAREFDPGDVLTAIDDLGGSVLVAVPAVLRMMSEHDQWDDVDLSSLRVVKSGGGPCRESVMDAWWDRDVDLSQGYGLTECGPNNFAMPDGWPREKAASVGVPDMHVETRIVDDGEPVDVGEIGELQIASPHAADRYWNDQAETTEAFGDGTVAPQRDRTVERGWVSTGDLARVDEDGYHYIEGRKKDMFVSGGENVYPAEVEDAVADHPDIAEVVVIPIADEQWGQVGKAVVELADDVDDLTVSSLRAFLDDRLARFKHPRELDFVDQMPTSGPSKIDRQAVIEQFGAPE